MKALLDTNIILDNLLEREPFANDARHIWQAHARGQYVGYISPITPVNVFYIARKLRSIEQARTGLEQMLALFEVCPLDGGILKAALHMSLKDFDDAVQYACAKAVGADVIITRDPGDFPVIDVAVLSPADFLSNL